MRTMILPYKMASKGAKALAAGLGIKQIKPDPDTSAYENKEDDVIINWGTSSERLPAHMRDVLNWVNHPDAVELSVDKMKSFQLMKDNDIPLVDFTTDQDLAHSWLKHGEPVVARTQVRGMKGKGIVYMTRPEHLVEAKLYTKFFEHEAEVRVHYGFGRIIEVHDKTGAGFKGTHSGNPYRIDSPHLEAIAAKTLTAFGLDFGAVDILYRYNDGQPESVVLEVNTAPQLDGGTLAAYVAAFERNYN